jgi:gliding-associated putative ABC transporter substrate-binding component GldG
MNFLKRFQFARDSYLVTALIVAIVLLANFIASRHFVRIDLTQSHLYALSDSSKDMMRNLDDIVTVKVLFSKTLPPNLFAVRQYVDDVLEELASYSKGRLQVMNLNPDSPDVATEAQKLGIPQVQMNIIEKDKLEVKNGFLGIAILYGDKKEVLPVVQQTASVEYDLMAAIKKVTAKQEKAVAFIVGHEEPTLSDKVGVGVPGDSYSFLKKALDRNYRVEEVTLSDEDSLDGFDTVLAIGPKTEYSDKEQFLIDQFLMNGGNLVALLDQVQVSQDLQTTQPILGLSDLMESYGVGFERALALDLSSENASFNQGYMNFIVPYSFWIRAINKFFEPGNPIVAKLDSVVFPWTSPLKLIPVEGVTGVSLVNSTTNAWSQSEPFNLAPNQVMGSSQKSQYPLAVSLEGNFPSAFKGKKSPLGTRDFPQASLKPGKILAIGNSRMVLDRFLAMFPQNLTFVMNAVDDMTLDQSLIAIRSKSSFDLPLKDLSATEREMVKAIGIFLMPILVILYGVLRSFSRRRKPVLH